MIGRPILLFGDAMATAARRLPLPWPRLPAPHEDPPDYPDDMPEPGALAYDPGPPGEGAASGTLTHQPSFPLRASMRFRTEVHRAQGGQVSAYARETEGREVWECIWAAVTSDELAVLLPQLRGAVEAPINWTPPGDAARAVKVRKPGPVSRKLAGAVWEVRATLYEVRT